MGMRIADLPNISDIDPDSYVIVETPGQGEGTYKGTVGDLQRAITVEASVSEVPSEKKVLIHVKDINGETNEYIVIPQASVKNNFDGTSTLTVVDAYGQTQSIFINTVSLDPWPTQGSTRLVTSGSLYTEFESDRDRITDVEVRLADAESVVSKLKKILMWEGTRSEWDALPLVEKSQYKIVCISDE